MTSNSFLLVLNILIISLFLPINVNAQFCRNGVNWVSSTCYPASSSCGTDQACTGTVTGCSPTNYYGCSSTKTCCAGYSIVTAGNICAGCTKLASYCPSTSTYASNTASNTQIDATVTWTCITGSLCNGSPTCVATCLSTATWSPTCTQTMNYCPAVANGGLTASSPPNYVINSVATVNCDAGYKCSGVSTTTCSLTCTSTKAWTGSCTLITAYCPSTTPLALNTASNLTIGATTTWACITGAACSGTCTSAAPSTCIAGGSWDSICIYVTNWCSPTIANGVVGPSAPSNNIILSTMTLTCNPGYVCSGGSCSATCTAATRTWSKTCDLIAVYCPITNMYASNVLVSSPIGSTVTWACIPGAACSGSCAATCMSGGTWSTQCIPSANYCPSSVVFGALSISSPSGFEVLSTATLSCNTGYGCTSDLGSCLVQCQTNQTWSNSCSFITSFCPSTISYGTITASAYSYQASGTITCTYGAFCGPTGQSSCSVTCGASRSWSESCNPASQWCLVKNGTVSASSPPDNVVGSVATLSCNSGYVCSGGDCHVTCQPNREWSQTCVPSGCEVSNTYGTASTSTPPGYIQGSTVVWTCISGAACNGNPTCSSTCNSTKQWTHLCAPIATSWCSTSITNGGVSISSESSQVLATATLTCSTGYQCSGDCNVVCQENREWSQSCVATPAWCSSKDTFGTLEASTPPNFVVGSTANWNCIVGASCNGEASCVAECTTSHSWSKRCTSIPNWCDNSLPNGRVAVGGSQPSNNVVTSTINILCDLGFVCSPDNCTATCQSDKFWSKQCLLTSCPTIFADNAIVTITSLLSTFNISATIDCIHGYVIPSTGLSQMNTSCISGSGGYIWSSPPTSCTPRNDYCSMPTVPSMSISSSPQREYFRRGEVINFSVICESGSSRTVVGLCEELTMSSGKWNTTFNCSESSVSSLVAPIAGGVSGSLFLIICFVLLIVFVNRRKAKKKVISEFQMTNNSLHDSSTKVLAVSKSSELDTVVTTTSNADPSSSTLLVSSPSFSPSPPALPPKPSNRLSTPPSIDRSQQHASVALIYDSHEVNLDQRLRALSANKKPVPLPSTPTPTFTSTFTSTQMQTQIPTEAAEEERNIYDHATLQSQYIRQSITLQAELGSGNFGTVYSATMPASLLVYAAPDLYSSSKVQSQSQGQSQSQAQAQAQHRESVAVKMMKTNSKTSEGFKKAKRDFEFEISVMKKFKHPNIVRMLMTLIDIEPFMLVLELLPYGDLKTLLKNSEASKLVWARQEFIHVIYQVSDALEYLAKNRFIHRDIASRNCLVGGSLTIKISDFGLSKDLEEEKDYYKLQTKGQLPVKWMAPETLHYRKFTLQSDIWSFGVLCWEVFSYAKPPYGDIKGPDVLVLLDNGERLEKPKDCSSEVYEFLLKCWNNDPEQRPTASQSLNFLQTLRKSSEPIRDIGLLVKNLSSK